MLQQIANRIQRDSRSCEDKLILARNALHSVSQLMILLVCVQELTTVEWLLEKNSLGFFKCVLNSCYFYFHCTVIFNLLFLQENINNFLEWVLFQFFCWKLDKMLHNCFKFRISFYKKTWDFLQLISLWLSCRTHGFLLFIQDAKRLESGLQLQHEAEIAGYLLESENLLRQQVIDAQILIDGKYYQADQLVQRYFIVYLYG